ncbi:hypothetical protein B7C51_23395 [Paenibacillus larvae subsp. pulvifaciens]|uniref:Uncharacterized protein n=1 Tax=Paenibacillus larvae subsp. pulvifaciens TaxID=1477 RepID=A0A1V0UY38_9BACL|nr:hypothetical protein B7C51_23395 [Paenibacillus larvae subsp. pulvifaciens]
MPKTCQVKAPLQIWRHSGLRMLFIYLRAVLINWYMMRATNTSLLKEVKENGVSPTRVKFKTSLQEVFILMFIIAMAIL